MSGQQPPANRAIAPTATLRQRFSGRRRLGAMVIGGGVALLAIVFAFSPSKPAPKPPPPPRPSHTTYEAPIPPPVEKVAASAPLQPPPPTSPAQPPPPARANLPGNPTSPRAGVYSFGVAPLPDYLKAKVEAANKPAAPAAGGINFKAVTLEGSQAFTLRNSALTLSPGPLICITDTLIVTGATSEAPFQCHLERDVMSKRGVVLLEADTRVTGHYQSLVGEGQNRIVAITATAETPNDVVIELGGPIGDALGAAGAPGSVDNHWGARLGGALILSLLDTASSLAQSKLQEGNGNTTLNLNSGSGGGGLQEMSRELLRKTVNIPPTITLSQGSRVTLWTTKYIDFSKSYVLENKR